MNQKGLLNAWDDAKDFGFITPDDGGERVFAHISSYAGRGRPVHNRKVTYSITKDAPGGIFGRNVRMIDAMLMRIREMRTD